MSSNEKQHDTPPKASPAANETPAPPDNSGGPSPDEIVASVIRISQDVRALAGVLPTLKPMPGLTKRSLHAIANLPVAFMRLALSASEQNPDLSIGRPVDVQQGRKTLDMLEVMPQLKTDLDIINRWVDYVMNGPRALLAIDCRDIYAHSRRIAKRSFASPIAAHARMMQQALNLIGRVGRGKKESTPVPEPAPAPEHVELKEAA